MSYEASFNDGSISNRDKDCFFVAIRAFYVEGVTIALKKLPFDDLVLNHAKFLNFEKHEDCTFDNVEYFCDNFHNVLEFTLAQIDKLQEEFTMYQLFREVHYSRHHMAASFSDRGWRRR